jgi:hypothetical protein
MKMYGDMETNGIEDARNQLIQRQTKLEEEEQEEILQTKIKDRNAHVGQIGNLSQRFFSTA